MYRGTLEEGALVRGGCCRDFVRRMYRGTPEEGVIGPGWMQSGMFLRF